MLDPDPLPKWNQARIEREDTTINTERASRKRQQQQKRPTRNRPPPLPSPPPASDGRVIHNGAAVAVAHRHVHRARGDGVKRRQLRAAAAAVAGRDAEPPARHLAPRAQRAGGELAAGHVHRVGDAPGLGPGQGRHVEAAGADLAISIGADARDLCFGGLGAVLGGFGRCWAVLGGVGRCWGEGFGYLGFRVFSDAAFDWGRPAAGGGVWVRQGGAPGLAERGARDGRGRGCARGSRGGARLAAPTDSKRGVGWPATGGAGPCRPVRTPPKSLQPRPGPARARARPHLAVREEHARVALPRAHARRGAGGDGAEGGDPGGEVDGGRVAKAQLRDCSGGGWGLGFKGLGGEKG